MKKIKRKPNEMFYRVGAKFVSSKITELENKKNTMVDYMKMKIKEEDWHGVADAAMDIRDIESELIPYKLFNNGNNKYLEF